MSDFESEHDSDSGEEAAATPNNNRPIDRPINAATLHASLHNEKDEKQASLGNKDAEKDQTESATASRSTENVADLTADFLAELKEQAGEKPNQGKIHGAEPWQLYLEQQETSATHTYQDPNDGTVYEWDAEKRAWFPKVDEDFIAAYQASYGFTETGEPIPPEVLAEKEREEKEKQQKLEEEQRNKKIAGQKRSAPEPGWFEIDPGKNHNVYVSGLPCDITEAEFGELMSKCGILMEDPDTGQLKVKLYKDKQGKNKGDGRCCYLRGESVQLALQLLDDSDYNGHTISVEQTMEVFFRCVVDMSTICSLFLYRTGQAVFHQKGEFNPTLKPKKKKKKKKKQTQEKLLDWVDRDNKRSKFDRIVILKHMFDVKEFEREPQLIIDMREEVTVECEKFGVVKKLLIFDRNPDGVCSVLFMEPEMADACIEALDGRWFGGKRISAVTYDGTTDYQVQETEVERAKRLKEWEDFLAHEELPASTVPTVETEGQQTKTE